MKVDSSKKDLSFTSQIGGDFKEVDLSGANLKRGVFDNANFEGADLSGADLRKASFKHANLMKANFQGADLRDAVFQKAKMNLSNFNGCRLDRADLRGIRGRYSIWNNSNWWDAKMNEDLRKVLSKKWPKKK
ncbi:MAG: hypothetical protein CMB56_005890 [Methanobacteriota archaeon]|nr:MAG: hypothetical protein CMB56_005890 [Euryarchaeota archaeon]